jgi:hypothetical protein
LLFNSGIPVKEGENYKFSVYARRETSFDVPLTVTIESTNGIIYGEAEIAVNNSEWTRYEAVIKSNATDTSSCLLIVTKGSGKVFLDMVSLFPELTFMNKPGGMREDISRLLADLKPKFMRFQEVVWCMMVHPNGSWRIIIVMITLRPMIRKFF